MTNKQAFNLNKMQISQEIIKKIPARFAIHYKVIPVDLQNNILTLACARPLDVTILDELAVIFSGTFKMVLVSEKDITDAIRQYYGVGAETIEKMMEDCSDALILPQKEISKIDEEERNASMSKFLNQILLEAYRDRATDIHIEPFEDMLFIRYRIDGVLYDAKVPSNIKHFQDSLISRIKILSNLNIAEKRLPQDGRFKVQVKDVDLDLRVSFLPTPYGESVVLRILNRTELFKIEELGFNESEKKHLEALLDKPHGIIFLTGPTGSGKTTTLYSCLSRMNTKERKIITIEDPIEYQIKGMIQVQVNPKIGLNFAEGLRSMLRHDPDVMMVGEVRDKETADIAIQVALTGHLIFSTLHTNDAAGGVTRLLDMGIQPYLITSTVECFIAQRLVRVLCPQCKQMLREEEAFDLIKNFNGTENLPSLRFPIKMYKSVGCDACAKTGYFGREAIYEILVMQEDIRQAIMKKETAGAIKSKAVSLGMTTLRQAGFKKALEGKTTLEEVLRVAQEG